MTARLTILACLAGALLIIMVPAGCIARTDVNPHTAGIEKNPSINNKQNSGDGGTNYGPVIIEGGAFTGLCITVIAIAYFWRKDRKALDWRVGEDMEQSDDWKNTMQNRACENRVEPEINKSVRRAKKKIAKVSKKFRAQSGEYGGPDQRRPRHPHDEK